jgi:hypothetical protein
MCAFYANFAGSDIVRTNPVRINGLGCAKDWLYAADMHITYGNAVRKCCGFDGGIVRRNSSHMVQQKLLGILLVYVRSYPFLRRVNPQ